MSGPDSGTATNHRPGSLYGDYFVKRGTHHLWGGRLEAIGAIITRIIDRFKRP